MQFFRTLERGANKTGKTSAIRSKFKDFTYQGHREKSRGWTQMATDFLEKSEFFRFSLSNSLRNTFLSVFTRVHRWLMDCFRLKCYQNTKIFRGCFSFVLQQRESIEPVNGPLLGREARSVETP